MRAWVSRATTNIPVVIVVYLTVNKFWPAHSSLIDEAVHDVVPGGRDKDRMSDHSLDGPTRRNSTDGVQRYAAAGTPGEKSDDKVAEEEGRYL